MKVLGVDLASSDWASNGSAVLTFENGLFTSVIAPAVAWPTCELTPQSLAAVLDEFARTEGVRAVAIDGPQGWRDPATPPGLPGVGRRCEYECRTQGKTGVFPQTFPGTQREWIEFSIAVFDALLALDDVQIARLNHADEVKRGGYALLECFPTSVWRASGLSPLPAKRRGPDLAAYASELATVYRLPVATWGAASHDDLQAVVAALVAAAFVGGPARAEAHGCEARVEELAAGWRRLEGLIWNAVPMNSPPPNESRRVCVRPLAGRHRTVEGLGLSDAAAVRVTQRVLDQVVAAGTAQAQIALSGFPSGTRVSRTIATFRVEDTEYELTIGDSHAAWRSHQGGAQAESFEMLFAYLSDRPGEWVYVQRDQP